MSQRVNITWDVIHEGGSGKEHKVSVYSDPNWAKKYDIIFHNECFGGVTDDDFVKGIAAAHHDGVPAVFVHCSLHSYRTLLSERMRGENSLESHREATKRNAALRPFA